MFLAEVDDRLFDRPSIPLHQIKKGRKKKISDKPANGEFVLYNMHDQGMNPNTKKKLRQLQIADHYRKENARLRKPCPTCNNLVQPHLQTQHNEAYHSKKA